MTAEQDDPLRPHSHDSNPEPPSPDSHFTLVLPDGRSRIITLADLYRLPVATVSNCIIVSTGHGISGPFTFTGVTLWDFVMAYWPGTWTEAEVVSADGFGNRVFVAEARNASSSGPIILAYGVDDTRLTRRQGVVRLIVPGERDDALRQVKWIGKIVIRDR